MTIVGNKKRRSVLWRALRYMIPADGDAVCGMIIVVFVAAFTWVMLDLMISNTQEGSFTTSGTISMILSIVAAICLVLIVCSFVVARKQKLNAYSIFIRCSTLLIVGITSAFVVGHLNRVLDHSLPHEVTLVLSETFVIKFGNNGYYLEPGEESFIAFDTPTGLENWKLVHLLRGRYPHLPSFQQFAVGQQYKVSAYPGRFGCPWFAFPRTSRLRKLFSNTPPPGTDLNGLHIGRSTVGREHDRKNIVSAHGCFCPDSPNLRQLEEWGVPVFLDDGCEY